jgi:hypothetical protein
MSVNKPHVLKIVFKTTLPKYTDLYLFEPDMISNNDELGNGQLENKYNIDNKYEDIINAITKNQYTPMIL